jgi:hypothetical protein
MNEQSNTAPGPKKRTGARIGLGCLTFYALMCVVFTVVAIADNNTRNRNVALAMFGVMAVLSCSGAYFWFRSMRNRDRRERSRESEKIVLHQASTCGGVTTLALIVQDTPLSSEEAEVALESLSRKGLVHLDLLEDGTVQYRFGGLVSE